EDGDSVAFDQIPPTARVRIVRLPFGGEDGCAVEQRTIDDVAVAGHPARVGHAEIDVVVLQIEHILGGGVGADHVAAVHVHDAFGFAGSARRIEDIKGG